MMLARFPLLVALTLAAAGCHRGSAPGATPDNNTVQAAQVPAPFAAPPVLAGTPDVATLVARVNPSVVNITATHDIKQRRIPFPFDLGPFGGFFGPQGGGPGDDGRDSVMKQRALGTGFLLDTRGHVATNAHVVEDADHVRVRLADERELDAKVIGRDAKLDLAVLELQGIKDPRDLPAAELGSSASLRVGEYVVAIGNPFGLGHTVTIGIVSAKGRSIGAGPYDDFIQTDASINPGNSGGPLFNLKGEVVGINTAINPQGRGIGFAIPIDALKDVLSQLLATGHVARGRLGVSIQAMDTTLARALGLDRAKGALLGDVEPGGPAEKAGLRSGDVILRVDEDTIESAHDLPRMIARHPPGSRVTLELLRNGKTQTVDATLDALEDAVKGDEPNADPSSKGNPTPGGFGIALGDAPGGGPRVMRVQPGSPADDSLLPGDIILEVNRQPVSSAADTLKALQSTPAGPVLLKVRREKAILYVAVARAARP
ncbi:Do family serine endopeptidase [Pendulispora albinea]|uniref:Do family serine endopeptidase n=1 Tax=Pendulispora albinea TaxID=2741071 RepID=A0ABZ2LYM0_9BACT